MLGSQVTDRVSSGVRAIGIAQRRTRRGKTTVDQTLMRGLVTAGPVFVLGLPLSQSRGSVPPNHIEGCPALPPRPPLCNGVSPFLSSCYCLLGRGSYAAQAFG